jgi:hypothetical protein
MNAAVLREDHTATGCQVKLNSDKVGEDVWDQRQKIAEQILGWVDWTDSVTGFLDCPGIDLHNSPDGYKDCRIKIDGAPSVSCFHQSCREVIEEANLRLRRALALADRAFNSSPNLTNSPVAHHQLSDSQRATDEAKNLTIEAKLGLAQILDQFETPPGQWINRSPEKISSKPSEQWRQLLQLYCKDDVLWIGTEVWESSETDFRFEQNFRTVSNWLGEEFCQGKFTCPSVFKDGVHSRSNANVVRRPYLVVESDVLAKTQVGAVFTWMSTFLALRAVVDTAGKSLHAWFEFPDKDAEQELRVILPALGCDPALFKPSQPCRLPGAMRNGRFQQLLYLDLNGVSA